MSSSRCDPDREDPPCSSSTSPTSTAVSRPTDLVCHPSDLADCVALCLRAAEADEGVDAVEVSSL